MGFFLFCSAERKLVQSIRQQQDEAYEESLRADQEKERLKKIEQDRLLQQQIELEAQRLAREQLKEVCNICTSPTSCTTI